MLSGSALQYSHSSFCSDFHVLAHSAKIWWILL
ncbi:unnamed protein product [Strongylus vulgaris]|uniref:Uncharacterized protein n=1 Tax=Strongylus vulgaris TaxID=40348 RepID=A0A3P7JBJ9_STRVU|nr:unnamed protein product [Strongylus vulgaris]